MEAVLPSPERLSSWEGPPSGGDARNVRGDTRALFRDARDSLGGVAISSRESLIARRDAGSAVWDAPGPTGGPENSRGDAALVFGHAQMR